MRTSKFSRFISVFFTIIVIAAACAAAIFVVRSRYIKLDYQAFPSAETSDELNNPYQGFYSIYGFRLSDQSDPTSDLDTVISRDKNPQLVLLEINLNYYSDSRISATALDQLDTILSAWSETGRQIILRFLYDWDGQNLETEPADANQVLTHMDQVAPTVNKYADSIYILQGIFVGNYGEMNNSAHLSDNNIRTFVNRLADRIDKSIFLAVRTPIHWRTATGYQMASTYFPAFDGSVTSRLGLYNDGMLGSDTDLGTYQSSRESELAFQKRICKYVPNGGEVVIDNEYNDLDNAISDLRQMHVSYLNSDYDEAVLDKWRNTAYYSVDCWGGVDGYTYIKEHLGYRYELRSTDVKFDTWFDDTALFSCILENVGFGSCLRELSVSFLLEESETSNMVEFPIEEDLREFESGDYLRLTSELPVRDYDSGKYRVYLKITDINTGALIKLATDLEQSENGVLLGEISLSGLL